MGSIGAAIRTNLGIETVRSILGEDAMSYYEYHEDFINALANAELEYNEDDEIIFKFAGKNKDTGKLTLMEVSGRTKQDVLNDIRNNGYTVQRLYTKQVYDALLNHTDAERWELSDATKIDNALLKKNKRK